MIRQGIIDKVSSTEIRSPLPGLQSIIELNLTRQGQSIMSKTKFILFFILSVLAGTGKGMVIIRPFSNDACMYSLTNIMMYCLPV